MIGSPFERIDAHVGHTMGCQFPGYHHAIAAVVPRPAEHHHARLLTPSPWDLPQNSLRRPASGPLHQDG